jgi:hypothetical protein
VRRKNKGKEMMDTIKKHLDTVTIIITTIATILAGVMWLNTRFNELEKEIAIIKTVLIMKNIMPTDLAVNGE